MLNDKQFDELSKPLINLYSEMEQELLKLIASKFSIYEDEGIKGSLEWWIKKLDEMGGLNSDAVKVIEKYSSKTETEILKMLEEVGYLSIDMPSLMDVYAKAGTLVNPKTVSIAKVIENSHKEVQETFRLIRTNAVEGAKQSYMTAINQVYLEVSSGIYDYDTALRKANHKMADNGITAATYVRDDGTEVKYSIESVVRRDTVTAINQTANKANEHMASELNAKHYYVSGHLGARNVGIGHKNHESWQEGVYLIVGSDEKYKNFYITTGYGLVDGLGGVNCRHLFWAFFPGISKIPKKLVDDGENSRVYELLQRQRAYERAVRKWKKRQVVADEISDVKDFDKATDKIKEYQQLLRNLINENPELRRDYSREQIAQQTI